MSQLATGVPRAAEHAAGERVVVGDRPLALNVVMTGASSALGERDHRRHVLAGAVADDDHRPLGARAAARSACSSRVGGRRDRRARRAGPSGPPARRRRAPAASAPRRGRRGGRRRARSIACLHRERGELGVVGARAGRSGSTRRRREGAPRGRPPGTRPGPSTCVCTWPVSASDRRAVDLRVPQARSAGWSRPGPAIVRQAAGRPVSLP